MVNHDGFRHTETCDDMIEYEQGNNIGIIRIGGHGFYPFCEIIKGHNNVIMIDGRRRFTGGEINAPFGEWAK